MQSMFAIRIKTVDQHVTSDANLDVYTGVLIFLQIMRGDMFFFSLKECQFSIYCVHGGVNFPRIKCVGIPNFLGCKFFFDTTTRVSLIIVISIQSAFMQLNN